MFHALTGSVSALTSHVHRHAARAHRRGWGWPGPRSLISLSLYCTLPPHKAAERAAGREWETGQKGQGKHIVLLLPVGDNAAPRRIQRASERVGRASAGPAGGHMHARCAHASGIFVLLRAGIEFLGLLVFWCVSCPPSLPPPTGLPLIVALESCVVDHSAVWLFLSIPGSFFADRGLVERVAFSGSNAAVSGRSGTIVEMLQ
nr:hypothetical protein CFP56_32183 [Quercus suber]